MPPYVLALNLLPVVCSMDLQCYNAEQTVMVYLLSYYQCDYAGDADCSLLGMTQ